jgi:hypothetical protein
MSKNSAFSHLNQSFDARGNECLGTVITISSSGRWFPINVLWDYEVSPGWKASWHRGTYSYGPTDLVIIGDSNSSMVEYLLDIE